MKDCGLGIPEARQKHVFRPFFQILPAISDLEGLTLGLFLSKKIIERHGGRMWFESKEGVGSVFCFGLPLA
ncbi:MAG: hypothetical protein HY675_04560 [Chloroflexi bacterium]|nr:hypothetical protein [Chloroflexota bacterium]